MCRFLIFLLSFLSTAVWAQSATGKQLLDRIKNEKWEKAEQLIQKTLSKDSINAEINFIASLLFLNSRYPHYNVDSSFYYLRSASYQIKKLSSKEKEKLSGIPLDSLTLTDQKQKVDSIAFESSKRIGSEESFNHFLKRYTNARQINLAIQLRDDAAFTAAIKKNSKSDYESFLKNYPNSIHTSTIQNKYSELIFIEFTKSGRLKSYEDFIREHPNNSFRSIAEQHVFEIATASGSQQSFLAFIKNYPKSKSTKKAIDVLFYLDDNFIETNQNLILDSLKKVINLNHSYWIPFIKSGQYGFMNSSGVEEVAPSFDKIHPDYLCGDIRTDYLITSRGILSRNGNFLYEGEVSEVKDLGDGFLKIDAASNTFLLHKSGFRIETEGIKDARVLAGRFLIVNKPSGWGIISFSGRALSAYIYEDISSFDDWIVLTKNGKKVVVTADQIGAVADQQPLPQSLVFDDVRRWADGLCWVRNDALEGVLNESLEFIIPLDRQVLSKTPFGFLRKKGNEFFIEGIKDMQGIAYDKVILQGHWMLTRQTRELPKLFDAQSGKRITDKADSIWFDKNIALVKAKDSIHAWLKPNLHLDFNLAANASLFGKDSSAWIVVEEKNKKAVYDALSGKKLFVADFEKIESPATGVFQIIKGNKKGMIDSNGKVILNPEYDAIIQSESGRFSLLKDKKFGLFDLTTRKLIKPMYERNIVQYNNQWFTAFKDGGWGFIQSDLKPVGKFQFNEIQYWNDSVAWVKENFQWKLMKIKSGEIALDKIRDFTYVKKYPHEHVVIIHRDNYYGVISNRHGIVIPATFTDIINLGDSETPLYFTEKHVEEADIYVVIYYNHQGKAIRKQAFEGEEYEKIFCEEN